MLVPDQRAGEDQSEILSHFGTSGVTVMHSDPPKDAIAEDSTNRSANMAISIFA